MTSVAAGFEPIAVDAASPTPLYLQLAEELRARIANQRVRVGDALPSERDLTMITGLSRVTVRRAIDTLLREGMLSRRRGSGTYVSARIEQPASVLAGFSADMRNRGAAPGSIWLDRQLAHPTPEEAMMLAAAPDSLVVRLSRVRTADGEPMAIERATIPAALLPSPDLVTDSLYQTLARLGAAPVRGLQRLQASLATAFEARHLPVPVGAAVLRIERRTFLASGAPVEFTRSAYRGDLYDFVTEVRDPAWASEGEHS
jgi:GntR family transcriptional regulator